MSGSIKSAHADLLNRLDQMQQAPYYATAKTFLAEAERTIVQLEGETERLRDALREIALAGMSGTGMESQEAMRDWHARQAWTFIGIAARALNPVANAREPAHD